MIKLLVVARITTLQNVSTNFRDGLTYGTCLIGQFAVACKFLYYKGLRSGIKYKLHVVISTFRIVRRANFAGIEVIRLYEFLLGPVIV